MAPHSLNARDASVTQDDNTLSPTIIAGIVVAAAIGVGAALWLAIQAYRKRVVSNRRQRRASAFGNLNLDFRGEKTSSLPSPGADIRFKDAFSREQLDSKVVMPERAVLRPGASRDEILQHYAAEGKLPRPFAPFANTGPPTPLSIDIANLEPPPQGSKLPSGRPSSTSSWLAPIFPLASGRNSRRISTQSAVSSVASNGAAQKKVRQIFDPVLPDELVVSVGEMLTLVQSHDDGWCIVGRDSGFRPGDAELGAIPAWCFVKPIKGLRAERPMRVSSLGVTVNLDASPRADPRDNVMSWSNF